MQIKPIKTKNGKTTAVILGIGAGILAIILLTRKAAAAPERVPTVDEILASRNHSELDAYYEQMSELYINDIISDSLYEELYQAYYTRWYEIQGE